MERGPATPSRREKDDAPSKKTGSRNRGSRFYLRAATVLLLVSLLVSSGIYAISKFTNSLQAQRTVAAYDTLGERFSSNYLQKGSGFNVRNVTVESDSETPLAIVTVCNYEQGRQMYVNPLDVPYALTMRLVRYDPVQGRYVAATAGDGSKRAARRSFSTVKNSPTARLFPQRSRRLPPRPTPTP